MKNFINKIEDFLKCSIDSTRYLLVGNAFGKRTIFLYKHNSSRPFVIAKIPGNEKAEFRCEVERKSSEFLNKIRIPNIRAINSIGILKYDQYKCYLYEACYSKSLYNMIPLVSKIPKVKYFKWVTSRLIDIYHCTREPENMHERSYGRCYQHGDAWLGNMGRMGNNLILYDLEFSQRNGTPLFDLLHFGLYYQVVIENIGKIKSRIISGEYSRDNERRIFSASVKNLEKAFLDDNRTSKTMRNCIHDYLKSCNIASEDAQFLVWQYFSVDRNIEDIPFDLAEKILF